MKLGTVTGSVWATRKDDGLTGQTLLCVDVDGNNIVAADRVGAGTGDRVLVAYGAAARAGQPDVPADAAVVAILDSVGGFPCQ